MPHHEPDPTAFSHVLEFLSAEGFDRIATAP